LNFFHSCAFSNYCINFILLLIFQNHDHIKAKNFLVRNNATRNWDCYKLFYPGKKNPFSMKGNFPFSQVNLQANPATKSHRLAGTKFIDQKKEYHKQLVFFFSNLKLLVEMDILCPVSLATKLISWH